MGFPNITIKTTDSNLQRLIATGDIGLLVAADHIAVPLTAIYMVEEAREKLKEAPVLLSLVEQYYSEIGGKSKLWVFSPGPGDLAKDIVAEHFKTLMRQSGYEITLIGLATGNASVEADSIVNTETKDVIGATLKTFGDAMLSNNTPVRVLVGALVKDGDGAFEESFKPREVDNPYVAVVIGSNKSGRCGAIGTVLGRACKYQPHEKIGSGRNGALAIGNVYCGSQLIEERADVEELHDRGVITFHKRQGRAGYFCGVDWMCTDGDYRLLAHGRVIDKAVRLVAQAGVPYIEDFLTLNSDGTLNETSVAEMETVFSNAVIKNMRDQISGAKVVIESVQDIINTSTLEVAIYVQPVGYMTWINVVIGLATSLDETN